MAVAVTQALREQVAWACRIVAAEGYADLTLGHVSARVPGTTTVLIKRKGVALDEVAPEDVIEFDLADEGPPVGPDMHLEAVLHDSRTPEKGAPCPECSSDFGSGPPLIKRYVDEDPSGASDHWICPECDSRWSEADYRLRVGANYLASAAALTADQMRDQYRIPPGTLRRWVTEGKVKRRGRDDHGRQMYDVTDALMQRDVTAEVIA